MTRCFYYGNGFDHLETSFKKGVIANGSDHVVPEGEQIIVISAQEPNQFYGFLAVSHGEEVGATAKKYWPDFHKPDVRVTRVQALTRLVHIPTELIGGMTQGGIRNSYRPQVVAYLLDKPVEITQYVAPIVINERPTIKSGEGFLYVLEIDHGFKIGITTNLERRMKQLEVPEKATVVGQWASKEYVTIEKLLHRMYADQRVPQSEWFMITRAELQQAIDFLDSTCTSLMPTSTELTKDYSFVEWLKSVVLVVWTLLSKIFSKSLPVSATTK